MHNAPVREASARSVPVRSVPARSASAPSPLALSLRLLLVVALLWGSLFALPISSYADVRPGDLVSNIAVGEGHPSVPDAPDIVADYAALCTRDGQVLWARDAHTSVPMASTTKIMTALVALENLEPGSPLLVTYGAASTEGSTANLREGDTATLKEFLIGMMVPSGNDAAVAIAENVAGTEISFVRMMNEKAQALGMKGTHYSNASGLTDEDNYTTAYDCLLLTRAAMGNDLFREVVSTSEATVRIAGRDEEYHSTNMLLTTMEGANGVKTGFTDDAGYCLVASAKRNNFELYAVVFHSSNEEQRFTDAQTLLEWGFAHYRTVELINATQPVATLACLSWIDKTVPVMAQAPVSAVLFDYDGEVTQEVTLFEKEGSIGKGEVVGNIVWTQRGEVVAKVDLVATEAQAAPGFWEGVVIWWKRLWGSLFGEPRHETSTTVLPDRFELEIANVKHK